MLIDFDIHEWAGGGKKKISYKRSASYLRKVAKNSINPGQRRSAAASLGVKNRARR
jgi:hypothetical protein